MGNALQAAPAGASFPMPDAVDSLTVEFNEAQRGRALREVTLPVCSRGGDPVVSALGCLDTSFAVSPDRPGTCVYQAQLTADIALRSCIRFTSHMPAGPLTAHTDGSERERRDDALVAGNATGAPNETAAQPIVDQEVRGVHSRDARVPWSPGSLHTGEALCVREAGAPLVLWAVSFAVVIPVWPPRAYSVH
jgi:hypothetical protein